MCDEDGELDTHANQEHDPDDDAGTEQDDAGGDHIPRPKGKRVQNVAETHSGLPVQPAGQDDRRGAHGSSEGGGEAVDQQTHQEADGQKEMPAALEHLRDPRNIGGVQGAYPILLCSQVNEEDNTEEVERRGDEGNGHDVKVGDLRPLAHDEGAGTHDRRHELAAGGCGGLHCGREGGRKADAHHHRDGERARSHGVRNGASGDGAQEPAGEGRHLRRPAHGPSQQGEGEADQEFSCSRAEQECPEENEEKDEGR